MQIRELSLKELFSVYDLICEIRDELEYDEFEDLIYDMRDRYKMVGILEGDTLISYAGICIDTNLYHKRHLLIEDFVTAQKYRQKGYGTMMLDYLRDYAKMAMCKNIVISCKSKTKETYLFYKKNGFETKNLVFSKGI